MNKGNKKWDIITATSIKTKKYLHIQCFMSISQTTQKVSSLIESKDNFKINLTRKMLNMKTGKKGKTILTISRMFRYLNP